MLDTVLKTKETKAQARTRPGSKELKTAMKTCMDCTMLPAPIIPLELYMIFKT